MASVCPLEERFTSAVGRRRTRRVAPRSHRSRRRSTPPPQRSGSPRRARRSAASFVGATNVGVMRFAFKTSPQETTWAQLLAVWTAADDIDVFESGWTFDHFYPIFGNSAGPCLEGWTTLTALAQATTRLRLGTLVTGIHYRDPAVLANMAAALDIGS